LDNGGQVALGAVCLLTQAVDQSSRRDQCPLTSLVPRSLQLARKQFRQHRPSRIPIDRHPFQMGWPRVVRRQSRGSQTCSDRQRRAKFSNSILSERIYKRSPPSPPPCAHPASSTTATNIPPPAALKAIALLRGKNLVLLGCHQQEQATGIG